ncbi:MAG: hypothetical protein ABI780_05295 [Ardenticatenales bacterium]
MDLAAPPPAPPPATLRERTFDDEALNAAGLHGLTAPQLRAIARGFGWTLTGLKRDGIVEQMEQYYLDPASTAKAAAALSPDLRKLLGIVGWLGMEPRSELAGGYDRLLAVLPSSARPAAPLNVGSAAITAAIERGLVLGDAGSSPPSLHAPWPLSIALPPPAWTPTLKAVPSSWRREPAGNGAADLAAAGLALLPEGRMRTIGPFGDQRIEWHGHWPVLRGESPARVHGGTRAQRIPTAATPLAKAARAIVARAVGDADEDRSAFVVAQLAGLGLLKADPKNGAWIDPDAFGGWLESSAQDQLAGAVLSWLQLQYPTWDEVSLLVHTDGGINHWRSVDMWRHTIMDYRRSRTNMRIDALFGLHRLPRPGGRGDGGWADGRALARLVTATWPARFLPSPDKDGWYIGDNDGRPLAFDSERGRRVAEALFAAQLRGPMRWLGLVETAVAPTGEEWAVRLSPIGRALLTGDDAALAAQTDVVWSASGAIATLGLRWGAAPALGALRRYGAYAGAATDDASPGVRFRLGPDTLQHAFGDGAGPADVVAGFAAVGAPLPPAIERAVEAWWAGWGTVNRYDGLAMVEVADEHLAKVLLATTALGKARIHQASPTAFIVAEESVDALVEELRRAGHTPRIEDAMASGAADAKGKTR